MMHESELLLASLGMVLGTGLLATFALLLARGRSRRLTILERALQSGALDPETRRMLAETLVKRPLLARLWAGGKLLVAVGWIAMFLGLGFLMSGERDLVQAAFPLALGGFAILSLPFALRELDARRGAAARR